MAATSEAPRVGIVFRPQLPPERLREVIASAEAVGLDDVWMWEDCFLEGGLTCAAAALAWSSSLRIGLGLMPAPLRNPALAAMEIATLAWLFPRTFHPGCGAWPALPPRWRCCANGRPRPGRCSAERLSPSAESTSVLTVSPLIGRQLPSRPCLSALAGRRHWLWPANSTMVSSSTRASRPTGSAGQSRWRQHAGPMRSWCTCCAEQGRRSGADRG